MTKYRWDTVEFTTFGTIPVLLACEQAKLEGVVLTKVNPPESRRVREVGLDALGLFISDGPQFFREYGTISEEDCSRLIGLWRLAEALRHRDSFAWEEAIKRLTASPNPELSALLGKVLAHQPGLELGRLLAEGLENVRLVLWWRGKDSDMEILPGLHCQNAKAALYALVLIRIAGGEGLGACLNCGKPLLRRRKTRKTCSDSCRYALYEKRKKEK